MGLFDSMGSHADAEATIRQKIEDFDVETTMKSLVTMFAIMKQDQRAEIAIDFIRAIEGTAQQFIRSLLSMSIDRADASEIDMIVDKARILAEAGEWFCNLRVLLEHAKESDEDNGEHGFFTSNKLAVNKFTENTRAFLIRQINKRDARKRRR